MSRGIKYLGSNCQPVNAETVESKLTNPINHSNEELNMSVPNTESTIESTASLLCSTDPQSVIDKVVMSEKAKVALEAMRVSKEAPNKFQWGAVALSAGLTAVMVTVDMLTSNEIQVDEDSNKYGYVSIAANALSSAIIAGAIQAGAQKAVSKINDNEKLNIFSAVTTANVVALGRVLAGDKITGFASTTLSNYMKDEEEVVA